MNKSTLFSLAMAACCCTGLSAQEANHMVLKANKLGAEIQPTMYGHFSRISTMAPMEVCMPNW